jgi:hypothetical protein
MALAEPSAFGGPPVVFWASAPIAPTETLLLLGGDLGPATTIEIRRLPDDADAKASEVYSRAYASSPVAADFYAFLQTLDTYSKTLGSDSTLVLTTDSDFFRLLKRIDPPAASAP